MQRATSPVQRSCAQLCLPGRLSLCQARRFDAWSARFRAGVSAGSAVLDEARASGRQRDLRMARPVSPVLPGDQKVRQSRHAAGGWRAVNGVPVRRWASSTTRSARRRQPDLYRTGPSRRCSRCGTRCAGARGSREMEDLLFSRRTVWPPRSYSC